MERKEVVFLATTESMGLLTFIDQNGNKVLMYPVTKAELVDGLDEATAEKVKEALDSALDAKLAGKLDKTGGSMTGDIDFGQSSKGLRWECANGDKYWLRPWSDTNIFQLVRENPTTGLSQYGVFNVNNDGSIQLNGPLTADSFTGEVKWSNLKDVPSYLATVGGEMTGAISFGQHSYGLEWKLADGDVYTVRPYVEGNVFQIVRSPADGTPGYGVIDVYENGTIGFACHRDKKPKTMGSVQEDGFHGDLHGTADAAKSVPWSGVTGAPDVVTKSGSDMTGYLNFGQSNAGLAWQCANGDIYNLRPYSPNNVFQLTRQNPNGIGEYGVMNVTGDGNITFGYPGVGNVVTITKDGISSNLIGKVNGYSFSAQTTDPGAGSALADGQVLFVYQ